MRHTALPFEVLRVAMTRACLVDLPFVQFRDAELEVYDTFERRYRTRLSELRRRERASGTPCGPHGLWCRRQRRHGSLWRPHTLDEVWLDVMYRRFDDLYVTVLSSGPYGGIPAVYVDGAPRYWVPTGEQQSHQAAAWRDDLSQRGVELDVDLARQRYGAAADNSLGKK